MPFFQAPLRLDDFQRASSAFPAASSSSAHRDPDSPSPNKKRRVDSVPPALGGRRNSAGASGSSSPAPRSAAAARKSETDAARRAEINARYEELTRDQARLQATLRLQDAWEDIQRRHSTMPGTGTPAPRARAASVGGGGTPRRHRPGRSRAIPVEEDDIIDLSTLDFVEDRGILRNSKAGGFAIGAYGGSGTEDIVVGLDTGGGDDDGTEADEDEEEEEELEDYTDSDAESYTSEDELGELDELPSQPSLVFREERRKEAERLKEVLEFQQQEALARGVSSGPSSRATPRPGNETLPAPVAAADEDDLDLFATSPPAASTPRRRQSSSPLVSPSKTPQRASQPPPRPSSSTSTLRRAVDHFHLASPAPSSRAKSRPLPSSPSSRAFSAPPKPISRGKAAGLPTPPSSFAAGRASQQAGPSRPPPSTSPLREVIYIDSPSPSPSPAPEARRPHRRSPSPELFGDMSPPIRRAASPELVAGPSTSKPNQVFQRPTPTPTPPPPRPAPPPAAAFSLTPAKPASATKKPRTKPRQHAFELIIDVPARRSRAPAKVATSKSMPNLASTSEVDKPVSRRTSGLSTPPLSKGPKDAPRSASMRPSPSMTQKASSSRFAPTPTEVLPAPPQLPASATDYEEDELLLSSPTKPARATPARRMSLPPPFRTMSVGPSDRAKATAWMSGGKKASLSALGGRDVFAEDDDSEDELGKCSLSSASFVLAALIYLLSPSHFLTLIFRLALQIQFTNPRRVHPERSLRFFVALWGVQAGVAAVGHGLSGSQGTKGRLGYVQRGVMLDFVGQAVTPSTFHLVALDIILAILQLATLLVAFGATVPSDLDSSSSGEAGRDYGPLLGVDEEEVFDEEEGDEAGPGGRKRRRSRNGYESVELEDEEEDGQWIGGAGDAYGPSSAKPPSPATSSSAFSTSSSSALSSSRYTRIPLIADFRLRTVWTEIARSSPSRTEVEDRGVEAMEEGRAAG
ncbi:hypothetical protein OF846_003201 [Rhodotorula toruloides]|nr:hypothetical protein OF846_003201 [Rhodotorula toruloides]